MGSMIDLYQELYFVFTTSSMRVFCIPFQFQGKLVPYDPTTSRKAIRVFRENRCAYRFGCIGSMGSARVTFAPAQNLRNRLKFPA
jgi:hypothetical protein